METTAKGCEYVADEMPISPASQDITDPTEAAELIQGYLTRRLEATTSRWSGRPILMLSGGVDSILIATVLAKVRPDALAVSFAQPGGTAAAELATARNVAQHCGLEHLVVEPDAMEFKQLLAQTVSLLDYPEPWEILAGLVLVAINEHALAHGADGAIVSGAGADALFLGGEENIDVDHWDAAVRAKITSNFTRERFIPDFYERLIDDPDRHIQVWQTVEAVRIAQRLHPTVVRGQDMRTDKKLFRDLAVKLGIPADLVSATKNPMQVSSGGLDAIVQLARTTLAKDYGTKTYSDPMSEDLEFTVARLMLQRLQRDSK